MSQEEHNHEELNDQLQVRRDKMNQLRDNGTKIGRAHV